MKLCALILSSLLVCVLSGQAIACPSQEAPNRQTAPRASAPKSGTDSTNPPRIDPAKEAAIRQLIDLTGAKALANQMMDEMQKNLKPVMANALPAGDCREKLIDLFFEKFRSKADLQKLIDLAVPLYDKYLSEEEIKGLIQFYSTPLGQKTLSVLPKLMGEMQSEGTKWGQDLGRQCMSEVLSEHPELRKALEDAAQNARPR
jgi:uncharacterized protein